jgi:hypothetical protein
MEWNASECVAMERERMRGDGTRANAWRWNRKGLKNTDIYLSGYERIYALVFHTGYALLAQLVLEHGSYESGVTGSSPVRSIFLLL